MTRSTHTPSIAETEAIYDLLAQAIDQAGSEKTELFLTKLALLQAQTIGCVPTIKKSIDTALQDL